MSYLPEQNTLPTASSPSGGQSLLLRSLIPYGDADPPPEQQDQKRLQQQPSQGWGAWWNSWSSRLSMAFSSVLHLQVSRRQVRGVVPIVAGTVLLTVLLMIISVSLVMRSDNPNGNSMFRRGGKDGLSACSEDGLLSLFDYSNDDCAYHNGCEFDSGGPPLAFHVVMTVGPRPQAGRHLSTSLLSLLLSDAAPASLTLLFTNRREKFLSADAGAIFSGNSSRANEDGGEEEDGKYNTGGGTGKKVKMGIPRSLLRLLQLAADGTSIAQHSFRPSSPPNSAASSSQSSSSSSSSSSRGRKRIRDDPRSKATGGQAEGAGDARGSQPKGRRGGFYLEFLPPTINPSSIASMYFYALQVPAVLAEPDLPVLVIEDDTIIDSNVRLRIQRALREIRSATPNATANNTKGTGSPWMSAGECTLLSLYRSDVVPHPLDEILTSYDESVRSKSRAQIEKDLESLPAAPPETAHNCSNNESSHDGGHRENASGNPVGACVSAASQNLTNTVDLADPRDLNPQTYIEGGWYWGTQALLFSPELRRRLIIYAAGIANGKGPANFAGLQDMLIFSYMFNNLVCKPANQIPGQPPAAGAKGTQAGNATANLDDRLICWADPSVKDRADKVQDDCRSFTIPGASQHIGAASGLFGKTSARFHIDMDSYVEQKERSRRRVRARRRGSQRGGVKNGGKGGKEKNADGFDDLRFDPLLPTTDVVGLW